MTHYMSVFFTTFRLHWKTFFRYFDDGLHREFFFVNDCVQIGSSNVALYAKIYRKVLYNNITMRFKNSQGCMWMQKNE